LFERRYKQSYNWFIRRGHINKPHEIHEELLPWFSVMQKTFFPLMLPATAHGIRAQSVAFLTGGEAAVVRGPIVTKSLTQLLRGSYWAEPTAPLDIVLIDLPPGTGDVPLSLAQAAPLDGAILVTTPQEIAVMDARKAGGMFQKLRVPLLGILENMSYFADSAGIHHALFGEGGGEALAQELGIQG
jgi:ATP-binding protein involved in chromosome partitioning